MPVFSREKVGISRWYDRVSGEKISSELLIFVLLKPGEVAVAAVVVVVVEIGGAAAHLSVAGSDINHNYYYTLSPCTHYLGGELSHSLLSLGGYMYDALGHARPQQQQQCHQSRR